MELRGEHLMLAPASSNDAEALLPAFNGDDQFNLWCGYDPGMTLAEVQADIMETENLPTGVVWRISDHAGTLVGVAETAFLPSPQSGWIGLLIIRHEFQGRGYGPEAAKLLEDHLFSYAGVREVGLAVLVQNAPALRFWEKRGYIRGLRCIDNDGHDVYQYRLSRSVGSNARYERQ